MQIKNGFSYVFKKSSRAFIVALLVSFFIWVLINLSKTYEKSVQIKLLYENSKQGSLVKSKDSILEVKIKGSGFSLLSTKLANLNYTIPTQKYNSKWEWSANDDQFKSLFPKSVQVLNVSPRKINFKLISLAKKKVPIKSFIKVNTKLGYGIVASNLSKDSILIYGEASLLDQIPFIKTDSLKLDEVYENVSGEIPLLKENTALRLATNSLQYNYEIERFTQGSFQLELQVKNVPMDKKMNIFPRQVQLQFQAPLSLFSAIRKEAFGVYVDYKDVNNSNSIPIHIEATPKGVSNVKVLKKSVTYLLIEL